MTHAIHPFRFPSHTTSVKGECDPADLRVSISPLSSWLFLQRSDSSTCLLRVPSAGSSVGPPLALIASRAGSSSLRRNTAQMSLCDRLFLNLSECRTLGDRLTLLVDRHKCEFENSLKERVASLKPERWQKKCGKAKKISLNDERRSHGQNYWHHWKMKSNLSVTYISILHFFSNRQKYALIC